jgi:hypothetical protein
MERVTLWTIQSQRHRELARRAFEAHFEYRAALHERTAELLDRQIQAVDPSMRAQPTRMADAPVGRWPALAWQRG